jgi:hypothetical protein
MKTNILSLTLFFACMADLPAQTTAIPNDGFENAVIVDYDIPLNYEGMKNSNSVSLVKTGQATVSKTSDGFSNSYALKLETKIRNADTIYGYITNANPLSSANIGGSPYAEKPSGLTGFYKCSIPSGDTAVILLAFKYQGNFLGIATQKFSGNVSAYTRFTLPVNLPMAPDTVIFRIGSSDFLVNKFNGLPGSMLQLDSLSFTGVATQPDGMNGDFESWNTYHFMKVLNWQSQGDSVRLSTDANSGNYALQLQVENVNGAAYIDNATSGTYSFGWPTGGNPYFLMMDSLIGYYKMLSPAGDSGLISATCYQQGSAIGSAYQTLPPAASYTRFAVPISLTQVPDTIRIDISAAFSSATIGTVLLVDDIHLFSESLSTTVLQSAAQNPIHVYPNPVTSSFSISGNTGSDGPSLLSLYTEKGSLIYRQDVRSKGIPGLQISLRDFPKGIYLLKLEQAGKVFSQKIILQ